MQISREIEAVLGRSRACLLERQNGTWDFFSHWRKKPRRCMSYHMLSKNLKSNLSSDLDWFTRKPKISWRLAALHGWELICPDLTKKSLGRALFSQKFPSQWCRLSDGALRR
jgi:hypothetical protein